MKTTPARLFGDLDLEIDSIGSFGDGLALHGEAGRVHVARSLPGERVRASVGGGRGELLEILRASPDRIVPPCRHFGALCGGCALQHWNDTAYADWKRGLVVAALERGGFAAPAVPPLVRTSPGARRRIDLAVKRREGGVLLGLHHGHGTDILDLAECPVMHPNLFALVAPLRKTLSSLACLRGVGSALINLLDSGPDMLLRTDGPLTPPDRTKLAAFAATAGLKRIAWALGTDASETAAQTEMPFVLFGGHRVEPAPGAFLQASAQGEAAIVAAVLGAVPARVTGRSRAIDLYAGIGTISFPLSGRLRVVAYEGDAQAVAAMRRAQAGARVETVQRDLARQPLSAKEFSGAAMIVLDPPYAGAAAQMPAIAASGVQRVVYVSCNPGALTKDTAVLAPAYALVGATAIDQFVWSAQVECVAIFERRK